MFLVSFAHRLFKINNINQIYGSETVQALIPLLDNYEADVRKPEQVTMLERMEMEIFMDAVMNTTEMREAYNLLNQKGLSYKSKLLSRLLDKRTICVHDRCLQWGLGPV